jgi:hypothetical protein
MVGECTVNGRYGAGKVRILCLHWWYSLGGSVHMGGHEPILCNCGQHSSGDSGLLSCWFSRSLCLFQDGRRKDILILTPVSLCSACKNFDKKSLSWSETISYGSPFLQYQWSKNNPAKCSAEILSLHGTRWMSALSLSVIETIILKPLSLGNSLMKSMATKSPRTSGTGRGCKGPVVAVVFDLFRMHSVHEGMYESTRSHLMFGQ